MWAIHQWHQIYNIDYVFVGFLLIRIRYRECKQNEKLRFEYEPVFFIYNIYLYTIRRREEKERKREIKKAAYERLELF